MRVMVMEGMWGGRIRSYRAEEARQMVREGRALLAEEPIHPKPAITSVHGRVVLPAGTPIVLANHPVRSVQELRVDGRRVAVDQDSPDVQDAARSLARAWGVRHH